jgi:hypothetical protein
MPHIPINPRIPAIPVEKKILQVVVKVWITMAIICTIHQIPTVRQGTTVIKMASQIIKTTAQQHQTA